MKEVYYTPLCSDVWTSPGVAQTPDVLPLIYGVIDPCIGQQLTTSHGRNITLNPNNTSLPINNFTIDEFGNHYNAVSIKGGLCQRPTISVSGSEPNGLKVYGMQDASVFKRTRQASRFLRENGILAEYVCMQARPKYFPMVGGGRDSKNMAVAPLVAFKRHILSLSEKNRPGVSRYINDRLTGLRLGLTVRSFMTPVRVEDICLLSEQMMSVYLRQTIDSLHKRRTSHYPTLELVRELNPDNESHQQIYVSTLLSQLIGEGYSALHNLGVVHTYPHEGNITLAAEIVDTDSLKGQGLFDDDDKVSPVNILTDLLRLIAGQYSASTTLRDGHTEAPNILRSYETHRRPKMSTVESLLFDALCYRYLDDVIYPKPEDKYKRSCVPKSKESEIVNDFDLTTAYHIIIDYVRRYCKKNKLPSHINGYNIQDMLANYERKRLIHLYGLGL